MNSKYLEFRKYRDYVGSKLTDREILEALAEELSELIQATLKLIRACGYNNNYTPKSVEEATNNFYEELNDVVCCLYLAQFILPSYGDIENYEKWKRWAERLGYHEDDES